MKTLRTEIGRTGVAGKSTTWQWICWKMVKLKQVRKHKISWVGMGSILHKISIKGCIITI